MSDKYDAKAAESLPCFYIISGACKQGHQEGCPAYFRPVVAAALRECAEEARGEHTPQGE